MSLIGTLNLGASALAVQQAALQVTGNNISNAGNADYTRETASIAPTPDQQVACREVFLGTGVNLTAVQRPGGLTRSRAACAAASLTTKPPIRHNNGSGACSRPSTN